MNMRPSSGLKADLAKRTGISLLAAILLPALGATEAAMANPPHRSTAGYPPAMLVWASVPRDAARTTPQERATGDEERAGPEDGKSSPPLALVTRRFERVPIWAFAVQGDELLIWPIGGWRAPAADGAAVGGERSPASAEPGRGATTDAATGATGSSSEVETAAWRRRGRRDRYSAVDAQRIPLSECVVIVAGGAARVSRGAGMLEEADGERFPGSPRMIDGGLAWRHRWLGLRPVEIDRTRSISLVPGAQPPAATALDAILLVNGDRVDGVLESLGSSLKVDGADGGTIEVPLERVAAVGLITPEEPPRSPRIWLVDGTVLDALPAVGAAGHDVEIDVERRVNDTSAATTAPPAGRSISIDFDNVLGFAPDPSCLLPFAALAPTELRVSGDLPQYALPRPERTPGQWVADGPPVVVRGPIVLGYRLPSVGCDFVALVGPAEPDRRWTDCELVIRDGTREVFRQHLDASSPLRWIHLGLESDALEIEVTEGERGPVRDAVRFSEAFLVRPRAEPSNAPR